MEKFSSSSSKCVVDCPCQQPAEHTSKLSCLTLHCILQGNVMQDEEHDVSRDFQRFSDSAAIIWIYLMI